MNGDQHPNALPDQYLGIWKALDQADRAAPSRQALSRQLGVSTHTIQRILVRGDVPHFDEPQTTRVVRAWARTLTRLAYHLGFDARAWIEQVGIEWTPEIEEASEEALQALVQRRKESGAAAATGVTKPTVNLGAILRTSREPWRLFVAIRPPFSDPRPGDDAGFFERLGRDLLGTIDPRRPIQVIRTRDILPRDPAQVLARTESPLPDIGMGYVQTVDRITMGYNFVPLPGWRVRPRILQFRPRFDEREPRPDHSPTWATILAMRSEHRCRLFLPAGDPLLRTVGGLPLPAVGAASRTRYLIEQAAECSGGAYLLCSNPLDPPFESPADVQGVAIRDIEVVPAEAPDFALAIVLGPGPPEWMRLVKTALQEGLFGSHRAATGRQYGDLVYRAWRQASSETAGVPIPTHIDWQVLNKASDDPVFCRAAGTQLIDRFSETLEGVPDVAARAAQVRQLATQLAPPSWIEAAADLEPAAKAPARAVTTRHPGRARPELVPFCHSCSAPLEIEHNRGASDRFCRYCSDERGRLRPREEVEGILTEWFRAWQRDISAEEARRRARLYMEALPAWSSN